MRFLITGSNGQLGSCLMRLQKGSIGLDLENTDIEADITSENVVEKIVEEDPDVIVHTAAITDLDYAEKNPRVAEKVNVEGTRNIVRAAERTEAHVIYISTDYVFGGERGEYSEEDNAKPQSVYAETKFKGEQEVIDADADWTILRPSVVFAENEENFFTWARAQLEETNQVSAVTDQICRPTYAPNLAEIIHEAAEKGLTGLYHATGDSCLTRYEAVQIMKEEFSLEGSVEKIERKDLSWDAYRPRDSSLVIKKLKSDFETKPISISEAFTRMKGK